MWVLKPQSRSKSSVRTLRHQPKLESIFHTYLLLGSGRCPLSGSSWGKTLLKGFWLQKYSVTVDAAINIAIDGRFQIQWQKNEWDLLIQLRNLLLTPCTIHSPVRSRGRICLVRVKLSRPVAVNQRLVVGIVQVFCILNGNLCALQFDFLFRLCKFLSCCPYLCLKINY